MPSEYGMAQTSAGERTRMNEDFRTLTSEVSIKFSDKELEIGIKDGKAFLLVPERDDLNNIIRTVGLFFIDKYGYSLGECKKGTAIDLNLFLELMFWNAERQKDTILRDNASKLRQFVMEELENRRS